MKSQGSRLESEGESIAMWIILVALKDLSYPLQNTATSKTLETLTI